MHRSVEILIGRLVTDDEFRAAYCRDPRGVLSGIGALGLELSVSEMRALLDTNVAVWERVAGDIDARLRKAHLPTGRNEPQSSG